MCLLWPKYRYVQGAVLWSTGLWVESFNQFECDGALTMPLANFDNDRLVLALRKARLAHDPIEAAALTAALPEWNPGLGT